MPSPRIAIPLPHSGDHEYAERAMPQYERAVEQAGGEPMRIPLNRSSCELTQMIKDCAGVLLPGSSADVDPAKYRADRSLRSAAPDAARDAVDTLLLEDAYKMRKPILGICYGLQSLNVYRGGSLIQHIPDFLPEESRSRVNHEAGKKVAIAHEVKIDMGSALAGILLDPNRLRDQPFHDQWKSGALAPRAIHVQSGASAPDGDNLVLPVNSSHHQSADAIGQGLRVSARCTADGVIEAIEGIASDHFVLAVQWHPERSIDLDEPSRAIFRAFIQAAR
jgi:putative glutamine amidotransferase